MTTPAPLQPRQLGRSRGYTAADLPERLRQWHAPRINRWERLCVTAGSVAIESLRSTDIAATELEAGDSRWFGPGMRWRVAAMNVVSRFELEIYAATLGQAAAPEPLRSRLLERTERREAADDTAFFALVAGLAPGEQRVVSGHFDVAELLEKVAQDATLLWHPLETPAGSFSAFVARSEKPYDLPVYMGRDHAVIEAALGAALDGDADGRRWLRAALERHLHIEEGLVFPAYVAARGSPGWVNGLLNEHRYLRRYLAELDDAGSRRKFLRLLDGHDEKEESVVYPDVQRELGPRAAELLSAAVRYRLAPS